MMTARRYPIVAIDGPAGAGKSTVSTRVAHVLGYQKLDTGAIYRCVALRALREGAVDDPQAVGRIAHDIAARKSIRFVPPFSPNQRADARRGEGDGPLSTAVRVLLDDVDVTSDIRSPEVGTAASRTSSVPAVRQALLAIQREFGREGRVVVEGRDIGSVVFPDAEAKFFLTATTRARAERRFTELTMGLGEAEAVNLTLEAVESEVRERDHRDSSRPIAPLIQAADAIVVDSTDRGIDEVVHDIVSRVHAIERRLNGEDVRENG